jgi:hypothetical protein
MHHLFCILSLLCCTSLSRAQDYAETFGSDYEFAVKTIESRSWWTDSLSKHGTHPDFALSVVFPELIRYSSICDFIEVKGLEVLYVQYGRDYADFSVGLFQMKPSFAEQVEKDLLKYNLPAKFPSLSLLHPSITGDAETRKARIMRLKEEKFQLLYLEAFLSIMDTLYPSYSGLSETEKLIFYSSAYNTGYFKDEKTILAETSKKRYYTGVIEPAEKFSYSGIALLFFSGRK